MVKELKETFFKMADGGVRAKDEGVTVLSEIRNPGKLNQLTRPISVYGIVKPTPTSGRPSAPEPASMFKIGMEKKIAKKYTNVRYNNTGRPDLDKGHLFALDLGGPDVPANIVGQYSRFQRNFRWRKIENKVKQMAEERGVHGEKLSMQVDILYAESKSFSRSAVPRAFKVTVINETSQSVLHTELIENKRDPADDEAMNEVLHKVDGLANTYQVAVQNFDGHEVDLVQRPPLRPKIEDAATQRAYAAQHSAPQYLQLLKTMPGNDDMDVDDSDYEYESASDSGSDMSTDSED